MTQVDGTVILGTAPLQLLDHPQQMHVAGVRGVVNMCAEYSGPTSSYSDLGITQLRLPTVDHFEPSLESMQLAIKFIKEHKARGERVYVHCKAGHGRAAAITLCWMLAESPSMSAEEGNALLHSKRKVRQTLWKQSNVQAFKAQVDAETDVRSKKK